MTMAVLSGVLLHAGIVGLHDAITADLDSYAWSPAPHESAGAAGPGTGALISALPVTVTPQQLAGERMGCWGDDWYHRIHISPTRLDLGNVVSTQLAAVAVWNAYLAPQTLLQIAGQDAGIELAGQAAAPVAFAGLQERVWQVSITPDGPAVLDVALEWQFAGGDAAAVMVTGNRIVAWGWVPNWQDGVTETLEWLTDVLASEVGVEQCRALRIAPRRLLAGQMLVEGRERQALDVALAGWGGRVWAVPVWPDIQLLTAAAGAGSEFIACDPDGRDFAPGAMVMLRGEYSWQVEVAECAAIESTGIALARPLQSDWAAGSRLYPARAARLVDQPELRRMTDRLQGLDVEFQVVEPCDWPAAAGAANYLGWPVLEMRPDESAELTSQLARLQASLDSGLAASPYVVELAGRAFPVIGHRWLGMGREERANYRALLYALRGRQGRIWLPTHADDITLMAQVEPSAMSIDIMHIGYTRFAAGLPGRRDLRIELQDGTVLYRRVTGSVEVSSDIERLTLSAALGVVVPPAAIRRACWMMLARLDSDSVVIEHITDCEGVARSSLVFRGVRDDDI